MPENIKNLLKTAGLMALGATTYIAGRVTVDRVDDHNVAHAVSLVQGCPSPNSGVGEFALSEAQTEIVRDFTERFPHLSSRLIERLSERNSSQGQSSRER